MKRESKQSQSAYLFDRVIMCLDLDEFFVQVERKRDSSLPGPIAILQHQDIICVSYEGDRKKPTWELF